MTDYLELAAGEDAAVLWEASREKGVPVIPAEDGLPAEGGLTSPGEGGFPLLEDLNRTDRQVLGSALSAAAHQRTDGADGLAAARGRRARMGEGALDRENLAGSAFVRSEMGQRGDHLWVKQVDLAFQRDSRRYDGPFSLY